MPLSRAQSRQVSEPLPKAGILGHTDTILEIRSSETSMQDLVFICRGILELYTGFVQDCQEANLFLETKFMFQGCIVRCLHDS